MSICKSTVQANKPRCSDAWLVPQNISFNYFIKQQIDGICKLFTANRHRAETTSEVSSKTQTESNHLTGHEMLLGRQ